MSANNTPPLEKTERSRSDSVTSPMHLFSPYVTSLERLVRDTTANGAHGQNGKAIRAALDGQPGEMLRNTIPLEIRRKSGAFFSGAKFGQLLIKPFSRTLIGRSVICDPACGVGDLLLGCAMQLPVVPDLNATLARWGEQLRGCDIHPEFVQATKARLVLLALRRSVSTESAGPLQLDSFFPHIRVGNGLGDVNFGPVTHIVVNPPYGLVAAPRHCEWTQGRVSEAATFLDFIITNCKPDTYVAAILPDVLRTGSRYARWRTRVESLAQVRTVEPYGLFDSWADVDVFVLRLLTRNSKDIVKQHRWWNFRGVSRQVIGSDFNVHVGPVVPFRDADEGPKYHYIHARVTPAWRIFEAVRGERRGYAGRTFDPPFVVIRRTSRPGMNQRAVGTIVVGKISVAVENHLIVAQPKTKAKAKELCKKLLANLRDARTSDFLNERIRCRHLTVSAINSIPWWV